ncbi:MAG: M20/M25/M40 family metallo-hydrolase [Actinomycetota bacterium]|nr:M20/M25/M40 family metallo-hydrolase [Actinomycetota bacterium]
MSSRKKVGFMAGAGLGAAAAAALRRRWSKADGEPPVERVATPPDAAGEAFLDALSRAIRIPTVSSDTGYDAAVFDEFHGFLAREYPLVHTRLEREVIEGHSLLYRWPGTDPDAAPFLLMAHQDVVPVEPGTEDGWDQGPFAGAIDGDHLWGRGALDDKGPLIALLQAVEALLGEDFAPVPTIYLFLGHDEESGGRGAVAAADLLGARGVRFSFVLDEGGAVAEDLLPGVTAPLALVGIGEKASLDVEIAARGEGGHSSAPPRHTAIGRVAAAIKQIEDHPMPARIDVQRPFLRALASVMRGPRATLLRNPDRFRPVVERRLSASPMTSALIRTTAAVTMISGGVKSNVLPQEARAVVNFRILPGDTVAGVLDHVLSTVGDEVRVTSRGFGGVAADPPPLSSTVSAGFAAVAATIDEVFPGVALAPWILLGATDSRFFRPIADDVYRFAPFTVTPDDMSRVHGTAERVRISDAAGAVAFYRGLIVRAGGLG